MSGSSNQYSTPRKSLRRKPPPPVDGEPVPAPINSPPQLPPRANLYAPELQTPPINTDGFRGYPEDLTEEDILKMSTPKPKGPRELPEYEFQMNDYNDPDRTPPYPIQDPVDDWDEPQQSPFYDKTPSHELNDQRAFTEDKKAEILNQSLTTPSKIPSLEVNSLSIQSPSRRSEVTPSYRTNYFSPGNSDTASRGDRSPSPKKIYGRSPSLMYERFQNQFDDEEPPEDEQEEDGEYWGNRNSYGAYQDHNYQDPNYTNTTDVFDDELESDNESPTSKLFDYSILPDLPSATTVSHDQNSPTKRMTLNSAISFVKGPGYFDDDNQISAKQQSIRRKNDALPPVPLDLPRLPFASSTLISRHFSECQNVWSIQRIFNWCLKLKTWLHESFISKKEFKKALIKLLVFHKRDIPLDSIGANVDQIISTLLKAGALSFDYGTVPNEDGEKALPDPAKLDETRATRTNPGIIFHENVPVSGVLVDLTDCYSYEKHHHTDLKANDTKIRCLSSRCYMNRVIDYEIKFRKTNINEIVLGEDWATHWKFSAEDIKGLDKELSKRQSLLFDLLRYEQTFIQRASCFVELVGPEFIKAVKMFLSRSEIVSINKFDDDVINPGKELLEIHKKSLFEPLLRILISNGKFIRDVSDIGNIYLNWSQVAKPALLKYMGTVPMIEELINLPVIKQWVDVNVRNFKSVQKLRVNGPLLFLSTFNSRYQQLPLQLSDIMKHYDEQDPEYVSLSKAIDGIKKTSSKVNEMKHHADNIHALKRIQKQVYWKNNVPKSHINFNSENRKFYYRGDVTRKGDLKINSSLNHIILLDNYMLICERIKNTKNVISNYRAVERAIPIEFLLVEIKERETPTIELNTITKTLTQSPGQVSPKHEFATDQEDQSIYPFKIRYAGHGKSNAYTFSTKSERERNLWVEHLMKARSNLCHRLSRVEPYKLKLISNSCFAYEESNKLSKLQCITQYDPIEKMAMDSLKVLHKLGYSSDLYTLPNTSGHIVYSTPQCASHFNYNNTTFYFIATLSGVYCCDMNNEWKRVVSISDTTQMSVLPGINLVIMLHGNGLTYYPLDVLINYYYGRKDSISSIGITNDPVSLFSVGKHRGITMLFYATKKSNSSGATNFKVCVPEVDNDGIFSSFKVVKKFYVQAECYGLSIFNSTFAVHTGKGIEVLELDKLLPRSIPELPFYDNKRVDGYTRKTSTGPNGAEIDTIRRAIYSTNSKPMGMFKLNNNSEFLLVYNECAIFVNKHGKLSRFTILRFDYKAKSIAFHNNHLFVVCDEVLEVWSISDFVKGTNRLIQVLVGKDIRMLSTERKIICAMANPVVPGLQILFQLYHNKTV